RSRIVPQSQIVLSRPQARLEAELPIVRTFRHGESSFVATLENFLSYNVYKNDLSKVRETSNPKTLRLHMTSRSVISINF
ncbi:hypothetical protein LINPERPRIM_LOCUS41284, partial [Linum perenne]